MIDNRELLRSRASSPPGDVPESWSGDLIPFIDGVRALKTRDIGVALAQTGWCLRADCCSGPDGLSRFALLPDDDLTFHGVLKSPLVSLDEDTLFTLAHGRAGSLWSNY